MSTLKECKVVMLPTKNKQATIVVFDDGSFRLPDIREGYFSPDNYAELYIVSETDAIEKDDYYINLKEPTEIYCADDDHVTWHNECKIIASTDKSLGITDHKISPVPNFVTFPQPSQSFIEKYCKLGGIDTIMVEYEAEIDDTYETEFYRSKIKALKETQGFNVIPKVSKDNTITIHPVKDFWIRKEVETLLVAFADNQGLLGSKQDIKRVNEWIKENL